MFYTYPTDVLLIRSKGPYPCIVPFDINDQKTVNSDCSNSEIKSEQLIDYVVHGWIGCFCPMLLYIPNFIKKGQWIDICPQCKQLSKPAAIITCLTLFNPFTDAHHYPRYALTSTENQRNVQLQEEAESLFGLISGLYASPQHSIAHRVCFPDQYLVMDSSAPPCIKAWASGKQQTPRHAHTNTK